MLTAFTRQDRFFLTACRADAQAAFCTRALSVASAVPGARMSRQVFSLLTLPFPRAAYAPERASRMQRQRALPVSFLTITKRRLLDEPFRLWRHRHT